MIAPMKLINRDNSFEIHCDVTDEQMTTAIRYAETVYPTNADTLADRGQFDPVKARLDNVVGKLGEEMAWEVVNHLYDGTSRPDYTIHRHKRFAADLVTPAGDLFAVKSQSVSMGKQRGVSWTFEQPDPQFFHRGTEFVPVSNPNLRVCLVSVDDDLKSGCVRAIIRANELPEFKYLVDRRLETKRAIYWRDLDTKPERIMWQP